MHYLLVLIVLGINVVGNIMTRVYFPTFFHIKSFVGIFKTLQKISKFILKSFPTFLVEKNYKDFQKKITGNDEKFSTHFIDIILVSGIFQSLK